MIEKRQTRDSRLTSSLTTSIRVSGCLVLCLQIHAFIASICGASPTKNGGVGTIVIVKVFSGIIFFLASFSSRIAAGSKFDQDYERCPTS